MNKAVNDRHMDGGCVITDYGDATLAGRSILVMDDDVDVCELFRLNFARLEMQFYCASNDDEVIALYQQSLDRHEPIDVVILDLNIPGYPGGIEVVKKVRALCAEVKIIVSSGDVQSPEMLNFLDYGFDGALEKIFDRQKMKALLLKLLCKPS